MCYATLIALQYESYRLSLTTDGLNRASHLDPWNPDYPYLAGHHALYAKQDVSAAIKDLRLAVRLNPYRAKYWLDLALSYEITGDAPEREQALEMAKKSEPTVPDVAWDVARFYLINGETEKGLTYLKGVMLYDPVRVQPGIELAWRATHDPQLLLDHLPPISDEYITLINFLLRQQKLEACNQVWDRLMTIHPSLQAELAFPYFESLLQNQPSQVVQAKRVWRDLVQADPRLKAYISPDNLVVNGGFEQEILAGGFDWRAWPPAGTTIAVDTEQFHSGARALLISFEGQGVSDTGLLQYVPVEPSTRYEFSAFTAAENIEGANGPQLSLVDAISGEQFVLTKELTGSAGWTRQLAVFQTGADTRLLKLRIVRNPGYTRIKGNLRVDDFSLKPVEAPSRQ